MVYSFEKMYDSPTITCYAYGRDRHILSGVAEYVKNGGSTYLMEPCVEDDTWLRKAKALEAFGEVVKAGFPEKKRVTLTLSGWKDAGESADSAGVEY